ncbi:MAG TPA: C25 family cysteine peptidase, partial [Thermoanaerobaculia bacterium]|nr:C25 family cysteine peptidase [Thermoanaerobaculia bacterium]
AATFAGVPVPLWVEDGGDGRFDRRDWLELAWHRDPSASLPLPGKPAAVRLSRDPAAARRMTAAAVPSREVDGALDGAVRLERDLLRLRFGDDDSRDDSWYWAKLTQVDEEPFTLALPLADLDRGSSRPVEIRVALRGWSKPGNKGAAAAGDHRVEVLLDGRAVAAAEWDGQEPRLVELPPVAPARLGAMPVLSLRVPARPVDDRGEPLIDVVLLDRVEVGFPRHGEVAGDGQESLLASAGVAALRSSARRLAVYGERGGRAVASAGDGAVRLAFSSAEGERWFAVPDGALLRPARVVRDEPSDLLTRQRQADYLMIAHGELLPAVRPLAEAHRDRGLSVALVDVQDVFDELSGGMADPRAIRAFVAHAYHHWPAPAPRFVLLVGDASWERGDASPDDARYADWTWRPGEVQRFVKNASTPYPRQEALRERDLVPTWSHRTRQGEAASDNFFVTVDGDDFHPDLAIGRFPAARPEEVAAMVEKSLSYLQAPLGPWRRRALWITNDLAYLQERADGQASTLAIRGWAADKVYPQAAERSNERHQQALLEAFDRGQLLVHFFGHGGRYIWRTGPPDPDKNHDLFTLEHLDALEPSRRLPVVLSLTCYSAPFDHPTADSIGEKLLRTPGRGAVAVLAASWRNGPTQSFSDALVESFTAGGTVGEAVMRAKRRVRFRDLVETYNLLGDPALPLALPRRQLEVTVQAAADGGLVATTELPDGGFRGRAVVEWLDERGDAVAAGEQEVDGERLETVLAAEESSAVVAISVYVWSEEARWDAMGGAGVAR